MVVWLWYTGHKAAVRGSGTHAAYVQVRAAGGGRGPAGLRAGSGALQLPGAPPADPRLQVGPGEVHPPCPRPHPPAPHQVLPRLHQPMYSCI